MQPLAEMSDGRLYDLLEASGEQARASIRLLAQFLEDGGESPAILAEAAQTSAKIADEIRTHLLHAVFTSLPKADIETLLRTIAAIPVAASRFAERFGLAANSMRDVDFAPALGWIEELTEIMLDAVRQLRGFESLDRIKELYVRLQTVTDRAETLIQEIVNRAYQHPATPLDLMTVKHPGERLIEIIDRCRAAGGLMNRISLQFL